MENIKSYRSPKTKVKGSNIAGRGLIAIKPIKKDEIVAIKGGYILEEKELDKYEDVIRDSDLQIADNFYLAPLSEEEFDDVMIFFNHSCEPNVGLQGNIVFVAMKDIQAGEEVTIDYAIFDNYDSKMECNCGTPTCRKVITGKDWMKKELQEKYKGYFSSYLEKKMHK